MKNLSKEFKNRINTPAGSAETEKLIIAKILVLLSRDKIQSYDCIYATLIAMGYKNRKGGRLVKKTVFKLIDIAKKQKEKKKESILSKVKKKIKNFFTKKDIEIVDTKKDIQIPLEMLKIMSIKIQISADFNSFLESYPDWYYSDGSKVSISTMKKEYTKLKKKHNLDAIFNNKLNFLIEYYNRDKSKILNSFDMKFNAIIHKREFYKDGKKLNLKDISKILNEKI